VRVRINGETHSLDKPPKIDRRRRHIVEAVVDRAVIRKKSRSRIAESCEAALSLGSGVMHVAFADDNRPEKEWQVVVHSQHLACDQCGRSFEPLTPHNFSFNSHLGWCEDCEGLGTQTGANPAALLQDQQMTLADGALLLWPDLAKPVSKLMLEALSRRTGVPLDVPFNQLNARARRILLHGAGETWFEVMPAKKGRGKSKARPMFRFQFKGLYPALEEASRLSPSLRGKLNHLVDEVECSACAGSRLRDDAAAVRFRKLTIDQLCRMPLGELQETVNKWKLNQREKRIANELVREIKNRVRFLNDVGLEYLTIGRTANSLSGGEAQRIRLASQLGSGLCGVLYVLDEPTIGLHPRDNTRLLAALHRLRDLGNTLLLVEHDRDVISGSDQIMDFGPAAGKHGGQIVAEGAPKALGKKKSSVTGPYLSGKKAIPVPSNRRPVIEPPEPGASSGKADAVREAMPSYAVRKKKPTKKKTTRKKATKKTAKSSKTTEAASLAAADMNPATDWLSVIGARHNNLRDVTVKIPLARFVAVTGPSGSGKSSLIEDVIYAALAKRLHRAHTMPGAHEDLTGLEHINKVIRVDQQPLGNSPTSNPATYTGAFEFIRKLFSQLPESKLRGYTPRRFSFNVPGGRCEECEGNGQLCIEMHFLPDVWVPCDTCHRKRYNPETLEVTYRGRSISDVLDMTCGEAVELFENIPKIRRILQTLCDVGLDYVTIGQSAPTLSGGEAQRVKLASELSRPDTGQTLYLLDEPTTGLHFDDLNKLLAVLQRLVDLGNTVVVIEHNLDVIKSVDWVIDMGPEAGAGGGQVVFAGTPERLVEYAEKHRPSGKATSANGKSAMRSHTGEALSPVLSVGPLEHRKLYDPEEADKKNTKQLSINDVGADTKMPWETRGEQWHTVERVGRRGEPCRWDGRILAKVVELIHESGDFSPTNWNHRTVVEIAAKKKSEGWFLHAITGEAWLLKLKFRVAKKTFNKEKLQARMPLPTLNQMEELPVYGNEPRVRVKNLRGPWQEVEIRLHSWEEADTPEFWRFVEEAVAGFKKQTERGALNPDDLTPWKVLGEKWHYMTKGFNQPPEWKPDLLKRICKMLEEAAPEGEFDWTNKVLVHFRVPGQKEPWASLMTKRSTHVELVLTGPKGRVALGRVADLGRESFVDSAHAKRDVVKMQFARMTDLKKGKLADFLNEHIAGITNEGDS
ncbi:MAG: excinuclease ABC subunit A, partial [Planctomycetota bacterium]